MALAVGIESGGRSSCNDGSSCVSSMPRLHGVHLLSGRCMCHVQTHMDNVEQNKPTILYIKCQISL
jgi:hypothetical protein